MFVGDNLGEMSLAPKLAQNIEDRLRRIGTYGSLTITKRDGQVVEFETRITERPLPEAA